jgi:hypothetical protein
MGALPLRVPVQGTCGRLEDAPLRALSRSVPSPAVPSSAMVHTPDVQHFQGSTRVCKVVSKALLECTILSGGAVL